MTHFNLAYKPFGERSILIEWPAKFDEDILQDVIKFKNKIQNLNTKQKLYIKSAYNSLLVTYNFTINKIYDDILELKTLYSSDFDTIVSNQKLWKIPVCYDEEFGIDLDDLSSLSKLSKDEIIALHSDCIYTVYFIGFLPGFLYLGGLNNQLNFPRKSTPRLRVKKGAVAIGGMQTGIYPNLSPGGWNVIGNSPINFFDVSKSQPCFAQPGDKIKFFPVSLEKYIQIKASVNNKIYQLESEVIGD